MSADESADDELAPILPSASAPAAALSWPRILHYGAPSFALTSIYGSPFHVLVNKYYLDTMLVKPIYISLGTAFARAVDAVTTPFFAWLLEQGRPRVRWLGRRGRYIVPSALGGAVALYYLFTPPADLPLSRLPLFYTAVSSFFLVSSSVLSVSYSALGMEVATQYDERTLLTGVESLFAFAGDIAYLALCAAVPDSKPGRADIDASSATHAAGGPRVGTGPTRCCSATPPTRPPRPAARPCTSGAGVCLCRAPSRPAASSASVSRRRAPRRRRRSPRWCRRCTAPRATPSSSCARNATRAAAPVTPC